MNLVVFNTEPGRHRDTENSLHPPLFSTQRLGVTGTEREYSSLSVPASLVPLCQNAVPFKFSTLRLGDTKTQRDNNSLSAPVSHVPLRQNIRGLVLLVL